MATTQFWERRISYSSVPNLTKFIFSFFSASYFFQTWFDIQSKIKENCLENISISETDFAYLYIANYFPEITYMYYV